LRKWLHISSWGMNILKADACANKPEPYWISPLLTVSHPRSQSVETVRLKQNLVAAFPETSTCRLDETEIPAEKRAPKVQVETRIHLDNECSRTARLWKLSPWTARLLYDISSTFAELGCNIEWLIERRAGRHRRILHHRQATKLASDRQRELHDTLSTFVEPAFR